MGLLRRYPLRRLSTERGFTLLEGMVASGLLATGLLALAAMQGVAMVKNVDAYELTRITAIASDMLERVQFNRKNARFYDGINTQNLASCAVIIQLQARGDCQIWATLVQGTQLENVQGTVTVGNVQAPIVLGQRPVTVTITWTGSQNGGASVKRPRTLTINRIIAPE